MSDKEFHDWHDEMFGFGYGTGENYTISALKEFSALLRDGSYDHERIEAAMGGTVAWLLINALCHADAIEYGTSPRYGWLTESGKAAFAYIDGKTNEEIYQVLMADYD